MEYLQIVLLGQIGSGKTTIFNRITNSNEAVEAGGPSVTINVFLKPSAYGEVRFKALDTPGFGSAIKKIDHVAGIMAAFLEGPVNRIIIVAKLERLDLMQKNILPIIAPLTRYRDMITILVTHWDLQQVHEQDKNIKQIKERFEKFNIKSFIFSSINENGTQTCEKILEEIKYTNPKSIELLESDYIQFDLAEFTCDLEIEIEISKVDLLQKFMRKAGGIRKFIQKYPSTSPTLNDVMHVLTLESKMIAEKTLEQFEKDNWEICNKMVKDCGAPLVFLLHTIQKKEMEMDLREIRKLAQQKLHSQSTHCFNHIRKCNFCGLIWMKVQGCDDGTICGKVPDAENQLKQSAPKRWTIIWKGDEIEEIQCHDKNNNFQKLQINFEQKLFNQSVPPKEGKQLGCGQRIIWREMVQLTQGELKELVDPGLQDYYCEQDEEIQKKFEESHKPFQQQLFQAIKIQQSAIVR